MYKRKRYVGKEENLRGNQSLVFSFEKRNVNIFRTKYAEIGALKRAHSPPAGISERLTKM